MINIQKAAIIGCGFVGTSIAFSLVQNGTPYPDITVTYAGKTCTIDQDYIIKYPKIVKPGKNRIIVKGRGNFSGSVKLTYYVEGL